MNGTTPIPERKASGWGRQAVGVGYRHPIRRPEVGGLEGRRGEGVTFYRVNNDKKVLGWSRAERFYSGHNNAICHLNGLFGWIPGFLRYVYIL